MLFVHLRPIFEWKLLFSGFGLCARFGKSSLGVLAVEAIVGFGKPGTTTTTQQPYRSLRTAGNSHSGFTALRNL
jgi:hypothetical protein